MSNTTIKVAASAVVGTAMALAVASPAFAWHPKGVITKYVQNQTTNGTMTDANNATSAVSAKTGDTLKYTIVVANDGAADSKGYNDMAKTVMTDTLPAGVELVSNPAQRTITADLGLLKPGQKVTKEYVVKVTSTKDGDVIENKACFTGDSTANDNPQKGCDVADVKVSVPPVVTPPVTPPTTTPQPTTPEVKGAGAEILPVTGPSNLFATAGAVTIVGYAANVLRLKRRAQQ